MAYQILYLVLCVLPCLVDSGSVTIDKPTLFANTLARWNIQYDILTPQNKRERIARFEDCYESVHRTTRTNKPLESLNAFCVMNNAEYEGRIAVYRRAFNRTRDLNEVLERLAPVAPSSGNSRRKRATPTSYTYWEEDFVSFVKVKDQLGCGSCWSFPVTGSIEAINKKLTGDPIIMTEQYWVDCGRPGSGCAGGNTREALQITEMRQYMMYNSSHYYTGYYEECKFDADIISGKNNAMHKVWFQAFTRLAASEDALIEGIQDSPVIFDSNVSNDLFKYSGGVFTDTSCETDSNAHSMLLVGYTPTTLRVRASYGTKWGEDGYASYARGAEQLSSCGVFNKMYTIKMTVRRDMEYAFCNDGKLGKYSDCKDSCTAMDATDKTGWTLATIPTRKHNQEVYEMIQNSNYAEQKSDDKFNVFWIGLKDKQQDGNYEWYDGTPVNYLNETSGGSKYGMFVKKTGKWTTKNSLTYTARGLCSRPKTCWNIGTAVSGGEVTFDRTELTEGTTATAKCKNGGTLSGASTLKCVGGSWDAALPSCTGGTVTCSKPTVDKATIAPADATIAAGAKYTVTCKDGYTLSGDKEVTCSDTGKLSTVPTCNKDEAKTCSKPDIAGGSVSPSDATIAAGAKYSVTCDSGYTLSGSKDVTCGSDGTLSTLPKCNKDSAKTCSKPTIQDGTVAPTSATIAAGAKYTVTCNSGYKISGTAQLTCGDDGTLPTSPTCAKDDSGSCNKPTIENGVVSPTSTSVADGGKYTVECNSDYVISGSATILCTKGSLATLPKCDAKSKCSAPSVSGGTVSPTTAIGGGETYSVTCNAKYTISGTATVTCSVSSSNKASLSTVPTCVADPHCTKPTISSGSVSPSSAKIYGGESYTVTCNTDYYVVGEGTLNCTVANGKATLTTSPTCKREECPGDAVKITSGTIKSGSKSNYYKGDKVVFECNANYVLEGNTYIKCFGTYWNSAGPTCTAINTKCDKFAVTKGKLGNAYPYFTGDQVKVSCKNKYILEGENPRECKASGWENAAATCTKNDGTYCKTLTAPTNGAMTCTNTKMVALTTCNVSCNTNYTSLSTLTETTCSKYYIWDHQSSTNAQANFAPCIEMIPPKARELNNKVKLVTEYCRNDEEKAKIAPALTELLTTGLEIPCMVQSTCKLASVDCWMASDKAIKIKFTLTQTQDMIDTTILKEAKVKIKAAVKGKTFTLSIESKKRRKKRATTLEVDSESLESDEAVTCETGEVVQDGVCAKCPAGYKTVNGTCEACPIATYNAAEGASECVDCADGTTTYGNGSTKADQCYTLCAAPEIHGGKLDVEAGTNVDPDDTLTLTCDETFELATISTFVCEDYNSTIKCNAVDECAASKVTLENGSVTGDTAPFASGESVTFACNDNYKLVGNKAASCSSRVWSNYAPVCTAVNTKCAGYTLTNGELSESSPHVTGESVKATCNYGYDVTGTNPRECKDAGWGSDAQTCKKNDGVCVELTAPANGELSSTARSIGTKVTVSCKSGYTTFSSTKEVECKQEGLLWSHQSYANSLGTFQPCAQIEAPSARKISGEFYISKSYCSTTAQKNKVTTAFDAYVKDTLQVPCIKDSKCQIENSVCVLDGTTIKISFHLKQTADLIDPDVLTTSNTFLSGKINDGSFSFSVDTSKKRAVESFTAESSTYTGTIDTTCASAKATVNNVCVECPAGYYGSTTCTQCAVGTYSTTAAAAKCTDCASGKTTYGKGSDSAEDCLELCSVPGVTRGTLSPPTGFKVAPLSQITLICDTGYKATNSTFACGSGNPECEEDDNSSATTGNSSSSTIIIVVVVVIVALVAVGSAGFLFYRFKVKSVTQLNNGNGKKNGMEADVIENGNVYQNASSGVKNTNI